MDANQRAQILRDLAGEIARRRLTAPALLLLNVLDPLSFFASQVALFTRPLTPLGRWRDYAAALEDEEGWKVLHSLVDSRDC
jgi:hypothetical protein